MADAPAPEVTLDSGHGVAVINKEEPGPFPPSVSQVHTPPTTDEGSHKDDDAVSSSSLSELDDEMEDEENRLRFEEAARAGAEAEQFSEVKPDRYENGVPIFTPTMEQFRDFQKYVKGVDPYGMQSGIVLIDPPQEWKRARKPLDDMVKTIKIKNPIMQEFHGAQGIYTQRNIEKMRSYNLPQWKSVCEQTENQPPARRGEKRLNADKLLGRGSTKGKKADSQLPPEGGKRKPGRPRSKPIKQEPNDSDSTLLAPPTPTSPDVKPAITTEIEETERDITPGATPSKMAKSTKPAPRPRGRPPKSTKKENSKDTETTVAARRLRNARDVVDVIDEEAFQDFDYRIHDHDQWTKERCEELEDKYWKSLNFSNPMYGADMPGSLFDEDTKEWNVAKLPNLLDLLGQPIPGVNTAYLYLGMWRATFAWHLEDVDLYSINYIHFGAPKQWYSVSQKDAPKFEAAMKSLWGQDAKTCDQFLRHKTYLVSPALLKSKFGVTINKVVHREGQFIITFPIGYHSGYNLGYNCAESVNFAIENWLQYGKTARKCQCESDSVFIDVDWFVRKMNGEPTPEYEEIEVTDDEDDMDEPVDLPTPPGSDRGKVKLGQKRKRSVKELGPNKKAKKIVKIRKVSKNQPCCLCPNDFSYEELLPTSHNQKAHRTCAMYTPETYIATQDGREMIFNVENISKARLELKCHECRQKKGSCFQCSSAKCTKSYHATCAMQAGVQVDKGEIAVWHEGIEYRDIGFDWRCRLHRTVKRTRITSELSGCNHNSNTWSNPEFRAYLVNLKPGELIQFQATYADDIEAGLVVNEYDRGQNSIVVKVLPEQKVIKEVDPAWVLFVDSATSCLQKPSANALELPEELQGKTASLPDSTERKPSEGDPFTEDPKTEWAEFVSAAPPLNPSQKPVDFSKEKQVWLYIGKTSKESKDHYTADPATFVHDPASVFLDTVQPPKPIMAPPPQPQRQSLSASYPMANLSARNMIPHNLQIHKFEPQRLDAKNSQSASDPLRHAAMLEMQKAGQYKSSQYRDLLAGAEARANQQARILQRQQAKVQNVEMSDRSTASTNFGIGIDRDAVERQKQFQQLASQQSRNMEKWQKEPFPTLPHFRGPLSDPNSMNHTAGFANSPPLRGPPTLPQPQQIPNTNSWMNSASTVSPQTSFAPPQSPTMRSMQSVSTQYTPSTLPLAPNGGNFMQYGQPSAVRQNFIGSQSIDQSFRMPYVASHDEATRVRSNSSRFESHRTSTIPPQQVTTEVERQRRISNPAYPFKSPDQIKAQKEADKISPPRSRAGSISMMSGSSGRPEGLRPSSSSASPMHTIDPDNPPQFINPNATQISPPGSSAGMRSSSGSLSGTPYQMGPPLQPQLKRSISNSAMIDNAMLATPPVPISNYVPRRTVHEHSNSSGGPYPTLQGPLLPKVSLGPVAPMAEPSEQLSRAIQPRPIASNGLVTNDRVIPQDFQTWQNQGGFWGRIASYYVQKHEGAATVYRSPFSAVARTEPIPSIAEVYYKTLSSIDQAKIDEYRAQIGR